MLRVVGQQCCVRLHGALDIKLSRLKPRENGRNIFGQQLPALMGLVTSFAHMLTTHEKTFTVLRLAFSTQILVQLKTLSYVQTDGATLLANNSQDCSELLRPFTRS